MSDERKRETDEDLIAELLDGDPADPRRARLAAERPELAAELAALERTAAELDRRAADGRDDELSAALGSADEDLERRLEVFALRTMERAPGPPVEPVEEADDARAPASPWRLLPGLIGLAAAAALLLILLDPGGESGSEPADGGGERGDLLLNDRQSTDAVFPTGPVAAWGPFRWTAETPAGTVRRVRVWAAEMAFGAPLFESPELVDRTWTPDPTILDELPASIAWRVVEIDPVTGEERVVHEALAQLAP